MKKIEICVIKSYVEEKSLVVGTKENVIKPENNTTLETYAWKYLRSFLKISRMENKTVPVFNKGWKGSI